MRRLRFALVAGLTLCLCSVAWASQTRPVPVTPSGISQDLLQPQTIYYASGLQAETRAYLLLPGVNLTRAQILALDANIKKIKYGAGVTLSAVTMNTSLVDGTAFLTNASVDLRAYVGFKFSTPDGSVGFARAAGTGETYTELFADLGFDNAGSWTDGAPWAIAASAAVKAAGASGAVTQAVGALGTLIKLSAVKSVQVADILYGVVGGNYDLNLGAGTGTLTGYVTQRSSTALGFAGFSAGSFTLTSASALQVLTPSATGVTIFNAASGGVQNWISKGTTPNAASFNVTITKN